MATVLADPEIGGFDVVSLMDRPSHDVRVAVEEFLTGRRTDELVVLYLSCHGITDARRRLYFAAIDTVGSRLASTAVDSLWVNDLMEQCRARQQILILDCCFSGAFARGAKGAESLGLDQLAPSGRGRAVLTASNDREYSFESLPSGQPLPTSAVPGSVFTAALVAGLRGAADVDRDGYITVDEVYAYAYQQVRASGVAQTPQRWLSGGEGELVLARNPAGKSIAPAPLPGSIRAALDSPLPGVRIGAVEELASWLSSADPAKISTATTELLKVAEADIRSVATCARAALESFEQAPPGHPEPDGGADPSTRRPWAVFALGACLVLVIAVVVTAIVRWPDAGSAGGGATTGPTSFEGGTAAPMPASEPLGQTELVVSMGADGESQALYLADTQRPRPGRRLTDQLGAETSPVLSPDRRTLIYLHLDQNNTASLRVAGAADLDGDRVLFELPAVCATVIRPAWNPEDASMVAVACGDEARHTTGVWLMRIDGTVIRSVERPSGRPRIGHLAFSADGKRLGFWASPDVDANDGRLYTVSVAGGKPQAIFPTQDPAAGHDAGLTFSPDGKHIAFARLVDNHFDVMVADTNGENMRALTSGSQRDDEPSWSPDSRWIAFRSAATTPDWPGTPALRIWIIRSDKEDRRLLWPENAPAQQRSPAWS